MSDEHGKADAKFLFGFFIGGLIGGLIIFFLGTKEGKKASQLLQKKGEKVLDDVMDQVEELKEKGEALVEQGEELREHVVDTMAEKKEELTGEAAKKLDSALAHIEELQERGRQTTAMLRRKFKNIPKKS